MRPPTYGSVRPRRVVDEQVDHVFEVGYECGRIAERKRRDHDLCRLADAVNNDTLDELAREVGFDLDGWRIGDEEIADGIAELEGMLRAETPEPPVDPPACPPWCVVDHGRQVDELGRECAAAGVEVRSLTHKTYDVRMVRFVDLVDGVVGEPEVRVGDDTFDAEAARRLTAAILNAADQVDEEGGE